MQNKKESKIKHFINKHKEKIIIGGVLFTVVAGSIIYVKTSKKAPIISTNNSQGLPVPKIKTEETFHGVPVSKLDEIAKQCYHGEGVYITKDGYLMFKFRSNRGHQTMTSQMSVGNGKIAPLFGSNRQSIDEFLEKVRSSVVFKD